MKKAHQPRRYRNSCGSRIRNLRYKADLTQDQLAAKVSLLGLTSFGQTTIAKIEGGYRTVQCFELVVIAAALQTEISDLVPNLDQLKPDLADLQKGQRKQE